MDSRWLGPCEVQAREGEHSYALRTGQNKRVKSHRTYMKEHGVDTQGDAKPMFWHKRTVPLGKEAPADCRVGKMLGHQVDDDGVHIFLVRKEGEEESEAEFVDAHGFLSKNAQDLLSYCLDNGLEDVFGLSSRELRILSRLM